MRIVVGVNGSAACPTALSYALEEARVRQAPVDVVVVWEEPSMPDYAGLAGIAEVSDAAEAAATQVGRRLLDDAVAARGGTDEVEARLLTRRGSAGPMLLTCVTAEDLVVVGAPRPGLLHRMLPGSVASYLLHHAPCPVVVVPEPVPVEIPDVGAAQVHPTLTHPVAVDDVEQQARLLR